jgi:hypothetical protein
MILGSGAIASMRGGVGAGVRDCGGVVASFRRRDPGDGREHGDRQHAVHERSHSPSSRAATVAAHEVGLASVLAIGYVGQTVIGRPI